MAAAARVPLLQDHRALQEQSMKIREEESISDPLFERLTSLELNCQNILQVLEKQNRTIQAAIETIRNFPSPSWMSWSESVQKKEQQSHQKAEFLEKQLQEYPKRHRDYQQITPALIKQFADMEQLLGARKFDRLERLIGTYEQREDVDVKNEYLPLRRACERVLKASAQVMAVVGHLFRNTHSLHRLLDGCFKKPQFKDPRGKVYVFKYFSTPEQSFSSSEFPCLQNALTTANPPDAPEKPPLAIAIPPDTGALMQEKFESLMDRLLEQQKQIAREWILTSEPERKGCGWAAWVDTKGGGMRLVEGEDPSPLIGRVKQREPD